MAKLLLATVLVLLIYGLYRKWQAQVESKTGSGASNKRDSLDGREAIEAEYRVIEEREDQDNG